MAVAGALLAARRGTGQASGAPGAIDIGSRRELFVDDALIDRLAGGARLDLQHPEPREVVLVHDAPWEGSGCGYHSIFQDGPLYRMYYKAGSIRVEIQDAAGRPVPGFALDDAQEVFGDSIERPVTWKPAADLSALAGQPVRLRFVLQDADLYAFQFGDP